MFTIEGKSNNINNKITIHTAFKKRSLIIFWRTRWKINRFSCFWCTESRGNFTSENSPISP